MAHYKIVILVLHLLCDNRPDPLGLGNLHPGLSWQLQTTERNCTQSAYEIIVTTDPWTLKRGGGGATVVWASGKVLSSQSVHVAYKGAPLVSGQRYYWQVRVWDEKGVASAWSRPAYWEMGLLAPGDWRARWIGPGYEEDSVHRPSPLLRRQFMVKNRPVLATLYITAHGLYEARLNGQRVSEARLSPGYTDYDHRLAYQAYDVTGLLRKGGNTAVVILGDGWYRGVFGPWNNANNYGHDASLLFQLVIHYRDGSADTVLSDGSWTSSTGGIRYADLYNGEIYDARQEPAGWTQNDFDDRGWTPVAVRDYPTANLVASEAPSVEPGVPFAPLRIFTAPNGERIIDFGQNLAGWVRCRLGGEAGDTIKLTHAEVLDSSGNFYTGNLREARAQDVYILDGKGPQTFEPHFTFHGFRYVRVEGLTGDIRPEDFQSVSLSSALPVTGDFHCSDSLINRLQQNIVWSQRSNFLDIPTDCPQRSERLGWTGDAEIFAPTAAFNERVDNFFDKWLQDLQLDQGPDGGVPNVVPNIVGRTLLRRPGGVAGWSDAAVIIPWTLFETYNDTAKLAASYPSMQAWVGYIHSHSPGALWTAGGYGDWLAPETPTDLPYISQCFYYYSTSLLARAAGVLGRPEDSSRYSRLSDTVRRAFLREYITPDARAISNTQAAYVLALYVGILPDSLTEKAMQRLVALIHANADHLGTGFLGTPDLCPVLSRYHEDSLAYTILLQRTLPSWLYPVTMGATTIWEKWNGLLPDGSITVGSFNHYAYGAIGHWLYSEVAGIQPGSPGYQTIIIHPHPDARLGTAKASYQSDYGLIRSAWKLEGGRLTMTVDIPANTHAEIWIPATDPQQVIPVGSGHYVFRGEKNTF